MSSQRQPACAQSGTNWTALTWQHFLRRLEQLDVEGPADQVDEALLAEETEAGRRSFQVAAGPGNSAQTSDSDSEAEDASSAEFLGSPSCELTRLEALLLPALVLLNSKQLDKTVRGLYTELGPDQLRWSTRDEFESFFTDEQVHNIHYYCRKTAVYIIPAYDKTTMTMCLAHQDWERVDVSPDQAHPVHVLLRRTRLDCLQELVLEVLMVGTPLFLANIAERMLA